LLGVWAVFVAELVSFYLVNILFQKAMFVSKPKHCEKLEHFDGSALPSRKVRRLL